MQLRHSSEGNRPSSHKDRLSLTQQVQPIFTSRQFLTAHSLFHNLFSSEEFALELGQTELLRAVFGRRQITHNDLFEMAYFHRREKKAVLFHLMRSLLQSNPKAEAVVMLNGERLPREELRQFLGERWGSFESRVIVLQHRNNSEFLFNLMYLPLLLKQREFLRMLIMCDINAFESSEKNSLQKYYRKIPKELSVFAFRKDFYDYRLMQKSTLGMMGEQTTSQQISDKVGAYLRKKNEHFRSTAILLAPFEYVGFCKSAEDAFKAVILRAEAETDRIQQIVVGVEPFMLDSAKFL